MTGASTTSRANLLWYNRMQCGKSGHSIVLLTNFQLFYFIMCWYEARSQFHHFLVFFMKKKPSVEACQSNINI